MNVKVELCECDGRAEDPLLSQPGQLDEVVGVAPRLEGDVAPLSVDGVLLEVHRAGDVVVDSEMATITITITIKITITITINTIKVSSLV